MKDLENELRIEINNLLRNVKKDCCPHVYGKLKEKGGYEQLEQQIIEMMATDGITPGACITNIENLYAGY
ncbi:MAG: hypothetical protein MJZ30_09335 [Paludibacteraceae bacterium]|nr:hypothetical protein [Paludibacteraceae bacterium]